jgi:hypothetical protein
VTTVATTTGTIIAFPASFQPGTAYNEAKVEITNNIGLCGAVPGDVLTQTGTQITISGMHYDVSSGVGVGAGQLYQTYVYDVSQYGMCHRFALFIHSCNLGPDCGAGHTKPLDKLGVINAFEKILSTVSFMNVPGVATGSGSSVATGSGLR